METWRQGDTVTRRWGDKETGENGTLCGISRFATVMVHFMNGYGSYERE